jgi:serpin B
MNRLFIGLVVSFSLPLSIVHANSGGSLGADMLEELSRDKDTFAFSPASISMAMSMVASGAQGDSLDEIIEVCYLPKAEKLNTHCLNLLTSLSYETPRLEIANALVLTGGNPSRVYEDILKNYYEAEIFTGGLDEINSWAKEKTKGKIPSILDSLDDETPLVLLNAVYFKGTWVNKFEKRLTQDRPFYSDYKSPIEVSTMVQTDQFSFVMKDDYKAICLPYVGGNSDVVDRTLRTLVVNDLGPSVSMVVIVPETQEAMDNLVENFFERQESIVSELFSQELREVDLYLPKFKIESKFDLIPTFKSLGLEAPFSFSNDFAPMGLEGQFSIGQIVHKAYVDVDEEGTEAAAVTAVAMLPSGMPEEKPAPPEFKVDRSFIFFIYDQPTKTILFLGKVTNP